MAILSPHSSDKGYFVKRKLFCKNTLEPELLQKSIFRTSNNNRALFCLYFNLISFNRQKDQYRLRELSRMSRSNIFDASSGLFKIHEHILRITVFFNCSSFIA